MATVNSAADDPLRQRAAIFDEKNAPPIGRERERVDGMKHARRTPRLGRAASERIVKRLTGSVTGADRVVRRSDVHRTTRRSSILKQPVERFGSENDCYLAGLGRRGVSPGRLSHRTSCLGDRRYDSSRSLTQLVVQAWKHPCQRCGDSRPKRCALSARFSRPVLRRRSPATLATVLDNPEIAQLKHDELARFVDELICPDVREQRREEAVTEERIGKSKGKAPGADRYDAMLTGGGDRKIAVARIFNEISGMRRVGAELQEIFSRPTSIKGGVTKDEAAQIKRRIEDTGGSVKITPARG